MEETSGQENSLNYSYEAEEAKEVLKEEVPVFITGNFKEGEDNEVVITAAEGRVLKK